MERVFHTIPPIVSPESEILILGTMPSPKSRRASFRFIMRTRKTVSGLRSHSRWMSPRRQPTRRKPS